MIDVCMMVGLSLRKTATYGKIEFEHIALIQSATQARGRLPAVLGSMMYGQCTVYVSINMYRMNVRFGYLCALAKQAFISQKIISEPFARQNNPG